MNLGRKLLLAPLLTGLVALAAGGFSAWRGDHDASQTRAVVKHGADLVQTMASTRDQVGGLHIGVYRTIGLIGSMDDTKVKAVRADTATQLEGMVRVLHGVAGEMGAEAASTAGLDGVGALLEKYKGQADVAIDLSSVDPNTGLAALQSADETYRKLASTLGAAIIKVGDHADAIADAAQQRARRIAVAMALVTLGAIVFAVGAAVRLQRGVVADLRLAQQLADEVAHGNLTRDINTQRQDELGLLMRSLAEMQTQLRGLVGNVRSSVDSIQVASSEVATGNLDFSQRTEQQASALQETAASMEQLGSTVTQNADNARQANQLAQGASDVAVKGGEVVGQVVETMKGINDSSRRIADIISVIDGIAFQTNILALNAAVEAARAGEQGRGFAVVASEVRSLAQRSATAAKEIKGLIGASVERVEQGSALADRAGATMTEIVNSIRRVTDIMGEISAASSEQSAGVAQVGEAISQLDQTTQQNAALVEESAAAAESLKDQAQRLVDVVAVFRLPHEEHRGSSFVAPLAANAPSGERRGPDRAGNVHRPAFKPTPALASAPAAQTFQAADKTGSDDWTSF